MNYSLNHTLYWDNSVFLLWLGLGTKTTWTSWFGLKYLFWLPRSRTETIQLPGENIRFCLPHKLLEMSTGPPTKTPAETSGQISNIQVSTKISIDMTRTLICLAALLAVTYTVITSIYTSWHNRQLMSTWCERDMPLWCKCQPQTYLWLAGMLTVAPHLTYRHKSGNKSTTVLKIIKSFLGSLNHSFTVLVHFQKKRLY